VKILFLPPDANADDNDDPGGDTREEDRGSYGDDGVGHGRPPNFQPAVVPLAPILFLLVQGTEPEDVGTRWRVFGTTQRLGLLG
jgi:hypothetical protein